jgi:hypothetical protein
LLPINVLQVWSIDGYLHQSFWILSYNRNFPIIFYKVLFGKPYFTSWCANWNHQTTLNNCITFEKFLSLSCMPPQSFQASYKVFAKHAYDRSSTRSWSFDLDTRALKLVFVLIVTQICITCPTMFYDIIP